MAILLKITLCIISSIFFIPRIECSTTSKERDEIRDDHVSSEASPVLNLRKEKHLDNFVAPKPKRKVVATPSRATEKSIQNPKSTEELLESFYNDQGGAQLFPDHYKDALEALLYGQDEVASGDFDAARKRVVSIFEQMPLFDNIWNRNADIFGLSVGNPIAYYGLRMLDFITQVGDVPTKGTLRMTAVVAQCAIVSRPTLPDFEPETVILDIDPKILEDSYRRLHVSTDLFRYWVKAITGGYEVELVVSLMEECTTKVTYTDNGSIIVSYPDTGHMIESVPSEIYDKTNFWWVVAPSGVPGDGRGYDRHWITGGMGGSSGQPVFLSDDKWFTRKVEHIGTGPYSEIETRAYQPEWFQHEFMHFLYGKWSEFGLEDSSHQWFDRSTWPDDFIGKWEPDYYAESITKRLLSATPSLAEVFQIRNPRPVSLGNINLDDIVGDYERRPILNDWHSVTISKISESKLLWRNAAGVEWSLLKQDQMLISSGSPYEDMEIMLKVVDGMVQGVYFFDLYQSLTNAPVPTRLPTNLPTLSSLPTSLSTSLPTTLPSSKATNSPTCSSTSFPTPSAVSPDPVSLGNINLDDIVGEYERRPILNDWHSVTISKISDSRLLWRNAAGVEWSLLKQNQMLISSGSPYEDMEIMLKVVDGMVQGVYFFDLYQSLTNIPAPACSPLSLLPTISSLPTTLPSSKATNSPTILSTSLPTTLPSSKATNSPTCSSTSFPTPSVASPNPVSLGNINLDDIVGEYERRPILNDWHFVTISKISDSRLLWRNGAGVEWSLLKQDQMLISSGSPYEDMEIMLKVVDGMVQGVYFFDLYQSLTNTPAPACSPPSLLPTLSSLPTISSCRNSFTSFFNSFLMMQDIF